VRYLCLKMLLFQGESTNVEEELSLEREIVRYSSVSLSPILSRTEKVEQHIRKKTHKLNVLRFWVEGGVIPLCGFGSSHSCLISSVFSPLIFSIPVSKVFLTEVSGKCVPFKFKCVNGGTSEGEYHV